MTHEKLRARIRRDLQECVALQENIRRQESDDIVASAGRHLTSALHLGDDALPNIREELDRSFGELASADTYLRTGHADQAYLAMLGAERGIVHAESRYSVFSQETSQRARNQASNFGVASYGLITTAIGLLCPPAGLFVGTAGVVGSMFLEDHLGGEPSSGFSPRTTLSSNQLYDRAQNHLAMLDSPEEFTPEFGSTLLEAELSRAQRHNPQRPRFTQKEISDIQKHFFSIIQAMRQTHRTQDQSDAEYLVSLTQTIFDLANMSNYNKDQPQMLGFLHGDGGNCEAQTRLLVSLLISSGLVPTGWQVTVQYFDGDSRNDPHAQIILYNRREHAFLNPLTGAYSHQTKSPLFHPAVLDAAYLILERQEPVRDFSDPALVIYRPESISHPHEIEGPASGPSSGGSHSPDSFPYPRTGIVADLGHAPNRATLQQPIFHREDEPTPTQHQPSGASTSSARSLVFREGMAPSQQVIDAMHHGIPFAQDPNGIYYFLSARHSRDFNLIPENPNNPLDRTQQDTFLTRIVNETLETPRWTQARQVTEELLIHPENLAFYTPTQISQAHDYIYFVDSIKGNTAANFSTRYPTLQHSLELWNNFKTTIFNNPSRVLRAMHGSTAVQQTQFAIFLTTLCEMNTANGRDLYLNLFRQSLQANYIPAVDSDLTEPNSLPIPRGLSGISLQPSRFSRPQQALSLHPETFYALLTGTLDTGYNAFSRTLAEGGENIQIEAQTSLLLTQLASLDFGTRRIESLQTLKRIFSAALLESDERDRFIAGPIDPQVHPLNNLVIDVEALIHRVQRRQTY